MIVGTIPFDSFWSAPWSAPLRAACVWLKRQPAPVVPFTPNYLAPGWLRPLCLQRWVGQAIGERLAWMRAHPDQAAFLYPEESVPAWTQSAWLSFERRWLRALELEALLWLFQVEVECLLRIMQTPPVLIGESDWTQAALSACEHIAQVYHEFTRRHQPRRVRSVLRQSLDRYVVWKGPREVA